MEKSVDPWNMEVKITPSASLIQHFQDWDQTKSGVKKLCAYNRAKQWVSLLLNRPEETPNSHKMRLTDHLAAIDHMAVAHRSGISHDDYLRSCLAPIAPIQTEDNIAKVDTNVEVVINDAVVNTEESDQVPEGTQSQNEGVKSPSDVKKDNAYQPICASIWKGVACEKTNCPRAHPSRCKDPNCLVLDQGLPRYKVLQCNNWHAEPRSKKKKAKKSVKKPTPRHVDRHVDEWPPLPTRSGPSTSKWTRGSSPQAGKIAPWSIPGAPFPTPISSNYPGNETAAWTSPSLGGSQTTWKTMIQSEPEIKLGNGTGPDDIPTMKNLEPISRILAVNVRGIECNGRLEQIRVLLTKHHASVAVLSETETSHSIAETTSIEGFKAFCPPNSVTGPPGKEVGVILMISDKLAASARPRPDINGDDSVQTIWMEIGIHNLIIGGIYRRARSSAELEKTEFIQLSNQIMKAASTGKKVLLLGDTNIDHNNPKHKKASEAEALLSDLEAANMRRLPCSLPTWKSYGRHKVCPCTKSVACDCPKSHLTSTIDNAYLSISECASLHVLEDAISDHFPILVNLDIKAKPKENAKTRTIYRRDISRLKVSDFENALEAKDWSPLYNTDDPNEAVALLIKLVKEALDTVAPLQAIKFRPDKPKINLKRDTLDTMALRDKARKSGNLEQFKLLRNTANKLIKRDKIQGVMKRLQKNPGPQQVWREAKSVLGRGRGMTLPECTTNTDPKETAKHQNDFFINKIARLTASFPSEINLQVASEEDAPEDDAKEIPEPKPKAKKNFSFTFATAGSVTRIIKKLKNTTAMGVDEIPIQVWKKGVVVLAGPIARVCNISLSTGIYPDIFKEAIIHPIFKGSGKDPRDPGSYRPVSILPSLSKILETVVQDALLDWLKLHITIKAILESLRILTRPLKPQPVPSQSQNYQTKFIQRFSYRNLASNA